VRASVVVSVGFLLWSLSGLAVAGEDVGLPSNSGPVLVEIDGVKLTLADYGRKHPGGMFKAYQGFYATQRKVVTDWIDEYLLERQAQKEKLTVAELLDKHITKPSARIPSEEALHTYYDGVDTEESYDAMRQRIIDHIRETKEAKVRNEYMKQLRADAKINLQFGAPRAQLALKDHSARGPQDAPVVIVEYADYECPYCHQTQGAIDQMEKENKGKVAFLFKDMPLPNHPNAQKAAEATHCAGSQGKYWEYHDILFKTHELTVPKLQEHARELKMDTAAFDKCLASGETAEAVKADFNEALNLGLQGTPGFFVNGRFFSGAMTIEQFNAAIGEELAISAAKGGKPTAQK